MKKNNKGFSLVELIVVIAIMAVLVGVLAPALLRYVEKSRIQKDASAVAEVSNAIVIAMSEEDVFKNTPTGSTVEIDGDAGTITVTATSGGTASYLQDVLDVTVKEVKFSSGDADDVTLTITVSDGVVTVAGTTTATGDAWKTAIVDAAKK